MLRLWMRIVVMVLLSALLLVVLAGVAGKVLASQGELRYSRLTPSNGAPRLALFALDISRDVRVQISQPFSAEALSWSPDGHYFAVTTNNVTYIDNGFARQRIADGEVAPIWSDNGARLIFTTNETRIFAAHADGSDVQMLVDSGDYSNPALSPDGTQILLQGNAPMAGIFLMGINGEGVQALTSGDERNPLWSPDGNRIALTQRSDEEVMHLILADASGQPESDLLFPTLAMMDYIWSPDSTRIAVWRGTRIGTEVFATRMDGSLTLLSSEIVPDIDLHLVGWSPDGQFLVVRRVAYSAQPAYVDLLDAATGLSAKHLQTYHIAFSPDGQTVAYVNAQGRLCIEALNSSVSQCLAESVPSFEQIAWLP